LLHDIGEMQPWSGSNTTRISAQNMDIGCGHNMCSYTLANGKPKQNVYE